MRRVLLSIALCSWRSTPPEYNALMNPSPAARTRSATSRSGRFIYIPGASPVQGALSVAFRICILRKSRSAEYSSSKEYGRG